MWPVNGYGLKPIEIKTNCFAVSLRVLLTGYQMTLFANQILPIGNILRFLATYYVSTWYAPPDANLVITALIINEF